MNNGRVLTVAQLQTHIAAVRQKVLAERMGVIGLRTSDRWAGPSVVECEGQAYDVVQAASVLAVREAVLAAADREEFTVVLTSLEPVVLGEDLLTRMAGGRLFSIDLWETVRGLFKAKQIDPTVRGKHIAQALLDHMPPTGYPPVPAGVLDAATVWRSLCRHAFQMGDGELDLARLLLWAATAPAGVDRYRSAPVELRGALRERLVTTLGNAAGSVLDFIDNGHAADSLALGIVCGVVFGRGRPPGLPTAIGPDQEVCPHDLRESAARLERFHGNAPVRPGVGDQLARAARDALRHSASDHAGGLISHLTRADQFLREIRADRLAWQSDLTPLGLEQRLERFAEAIQEALAAPDASGAPLDGNVVRRCEDLAREVIAHSVIHDSPGRRASLQMAARLLRWLAQPSRETADLATHVNLFRDDHAYADWAREVISSGDDHPAVSAAYRSLEQAVRRRREVFNRSFATLLAEITTRSVAPTGVVPVEHFLKRVLAPLAAANNRLLLIVLDGMSWAVAHELLVGLRPGHWQEMTWVQEDSPPPPLLAAIPSITEVSRTSLLTGQVRRGNADDEKRHFAEHSALSAACARRHPPVLLHKADLTEGSRGGLSEQAAQLVLNTDKRVVGVVINAIDDRLEGAQQVRDRWSVEQVKPLGALLQAARDSGRVVVLASDHGHVWHREDAVLRKSDGGERWRPVSGEIHPDELLLQGPRVRTPRDETRVIVPWEERLRYATARNGYHGGATPQEMLAPLILLAPASGQGRKGLYRCQLAAPAWWNPTAPERTPVRFAEPPPQAPTPPLPEKRDLFNWVSTTTVEETEPLASPATDWTTRLLSSPIYLAQKALVQKHLPEDAVIVRCLETLDRHGGTLTPTALAQQAGVLPLRLDGLLVKVQRLLNVDGYEVLLVDRTQNRVSLNVALLKRQFELE